MSDQRERDYVPGDFPDEADLPADAQADVAAGLVAHEWPEDFRAGFVCLVGRPNAGKSTLTNALVGQKVAIMSDRPQTTRHTIRGIVHREDGQLVLVDTPGLHRPRTLLGKRLNDLVRETLTEVDAVVLCLPADEKVGPGDRFIVEELRALRTPVIAAVTKADKVGRERMMTHLLAVQELMDFAEIVPVSAVEGRQVELLADLLLERMPLSPPLYPAGELTDEPENVMIAELVREAALEGVREELPHSLAVVVEEIIERPAGGEGPTSRRSPRMDVHVSVYVERDSQKGIVIGKGGSRLKEVGATARREIEALLGAHVYLDLHVRVAKDWQRDAKLLGKLGF